MPAEGAGSSMSVHGEYSRALRSVLERLEECEGLVGREWRDTLDGAQLRPELDLSSAARVAIAGVAGLEAELSHAGAAVEVAAISAADRARLQPLRDACHHLHAHCHAILGGEPLDR